MIWIAVITPLVTTATAVAGTKPAPEPPPDQVTVGTLAYPEPPLATAIAVIVPP